MLNKTLPGVKEAIITSRVFQPIITGMLPHMHPLIGGQEKKHQDLEMTICRERLASCC